MCLLPTCLWGSVFHTGSYEFIMYSEYLVCVVYVCYKCLFLVPNLYFFFIRDVFEKWKFLLVFRTVFIVLPTADSCSSTHWQKQLSLLTGPSQMPGKPTQANRIRVSPRDLLSKHCWLSNRYFNPQPRILHREQPRALTPNQVSPEIAPQVKKSLILTWQHFSIFFWSYL